MAAAFLGPALEAGAGLLGGLTNILGGDEAANALKDAQRKARFDLTQGYGAGKGFQQPIYDKALGSYSNLTERYGTGQFNNPTMTPYQFDPQSVFQDPEYKAQLQAGTEAINQGAQGKGTLFSGSNARDLMKYGSNLFANRSDTLYNRGFDATNTAYNQNAQNRLTSFNEGNALSQPLMGSANNLSDLAVSEGGDLANNDLGSGQIRANNIMGTAGNLVNMGTGLFNQANKGLSNLGLGKK